MKKKLLLIPLALLLAISLVAIGCPAPAPEEPTPTPAPPAPAPPAEPIKIGALLPMTGSFAEYGPMFKAAIELRLDEAGWEVAGRPIQLLIEDDKSTDTDAGLAKTRKMVEADKIAIMLGPLHGGIGLAVDSYLAEHKMPNIAVSRQGVEMKESGWNFLHAGTTRAYSQPIGWWAYEGMGFRTANTIATDYVAGHRYMGGAVEGFTAKGGTVVLEQLTPLPTLDYAPYVVALKDADVVMTWLAGPDTLNFLTAFYEFGLDEKMEVIIVIGEEFLREEQMPAFGDKILGITGVVDYNWSMDTPLNKKFVEGIEAKTGVKPVPMNSRAYDAASIAIAALEATGGDTTPEKLRQAILGLELVQPSGSLSFTATGVGIRDAHIVEVQKIEGKNTWVIVHTYPKFGVE